MTRGHRGSLLLRCRTFSGPFSKPAYPGAPQSPHTSTIGTARSRNGQGQAQVRQRVGLVVRGRPTPRRPGRFLPIALPRRVVVCTCATGGAGVSAVVAGSFFLSYSRVDAGEFALRLADRLTGGPPSYPVWVDQRDLHPGEDWDEQIVEAIRACRAVLFVMTADSVGPESGCKPEWVRALKYKKPVIPLRLHAEAELPYRLGSRQYVDFGGDVDAGLARLREHLAWTSTPEGVLRELRTRLADAGMELPRVEPARRPLDEGEIAALRRRIEVQQGLIDNPDAVQEQTSRRIETGLERERQPEKPISVGRRAKFVNPPPMTAPGYFQDRQVETGLVADFLRTPELRMMTVVGRGGVGKTAMVCRLLKALEAGRLPDEPGELSVDGIVYLTPVGAHPVSFPNVFADLCRLLPDPDAERLGQRYRDPQETPAALMLALLEAFPAGRYVLLLDNFEDVVDAATGAVTDPALELSLIH